MAGRAGRWSSMGGAARISYQQLACLTFTLQGTAAVLFLPTGSARIGGSGGWLASFIGLILGGLPITLMVGALVNRHPGQGLGELATNLLGKAMGGLAALVLGLFSLALTTLSLRDVAEIVPVPILPETPMLVVAIAFLLVAVYGTYSGAEVLSRMAVFAFGMIAFTALLSLVALWGSVSPLRLLPLIECDITQPLQAALPSIGWYAEVWSFFPFAAMVDKGGRAGRGLVVGGLNSALFLSIMTGLSIALFGADLVAVMNFPVYSLVQQITIGEFVERLDVLIIAIWLFGMVVKVSAHLWTCTNSIAFVLGMKDDRRLLPIVALVALYLTMQIPNLHWLVDFSTMTWTPISLSIGLSVPGLLLAASWIQGLRTRSRSGVGA